MNYDGILQFKGTWRSYQARVLKNTDRYMSDGKIHIVAAPGSGKTTLGIELIRRMNGKARSGSSGSQGLRKLFYVRACRGKIFFHRI